MPRHRPIVFAALLLSATAPAAAQEMQFGTTSPPGNVQYFSAVEFAERVNKRLAGKGKLVVFHSSQLGNDQEMMQKLRLGSQDMSQPSTIMSSVVPEFGMFDLPYLVKDREHMKCLAKVIVWPVLAPKLEARGYKLIGIWENGFRQISNNLRPINRPEDMKGMKIRIPQGIWRARMLEAFGAAAVPMGFAETFVALQTGVVDGQENPYVNIFAGKFHEVQKFLTETNHTYTPSFPTASKRKFDAYPEEVKRALLEEAAAVQDLTYQQAEKLDDEAKNKMIAAGMQFNKSDYDSFVRASRPVYDRFSAEVPGADKLIEQAIALAKGC